MAIFGRNHLPHRSTLSRFLAALDQSTMEALRALFQEDLLARKPFPSPGGLFDRREVQWIVVDVDGTRQAARHVRFLKRSHCLPPIGASTRCVRQDIRGASAEKWFARARSFSRRIRINF
jgi:hypothetical protein